jgi:hypothetical protein
MAAGFHRVNSSNANENLEPNYYPIRSTEALTGGDAIQLNGSGEIIAAVAGSPLLGYLEYKGSIVGDGTTLGCAVVDPGMELEVDYDSISTALLKAGMYLALNATQDGVDEVAGASATIDPGGANNALVWEAKPAWYGPVGDTISVEYRDPNAAVTNATLTINPGGANDALVWTATPAWGGEEGNAITVEYVNPNKGVVAATLTIDPAGANNALVWTAKDAWSGARGNDITVEYRDTAHGTAESIVVTGTGIVVILATNAGTGAIESTGDTIKATLAGHAAANAMVTAVDLAGNDGSAIVTLMAETNLAGGVGVQHLNAVESIQVVGTGILVNLATGATGSVTSTGDTVKATLAADPVASLMVTAVDLAGNDGSGLLTLMDEAPLTGGHGVLEINAVEAIEVVGTAIIVNLATGATGAVTSTGDTIKATLLLHPVAAAMVTAVDAAANDGSGLVTGMIPARLSGGTGDFVITQGYNSRLPREGKVWVKIVDKQLG